MKKTLAIMALLALPSGSVWAQCVGYSGLGGGLSTGPGGGLSNTPKHGDATVKVAGIEAVATNA